MNFLERCRKVISIDSTPSNGNLDLTEWLASYCESQGFYIEKQNDFLGDHQHQNIIIRTQSQKPPEEFLFQTHLDTVEPGAFGAWLQNGFNPFDATIVDGKIYGLGSADAKLDFICKLEALSFFKEIKKWKLPPVLVGTYGEKLGMPGIVKLIRQDKISAKKAFVGEPTQLQILTAGMGYMAVEISVPFTREEVLRRREKIQESSNTQTKLFFGKVAHSSAPHLGDSAIKKMFDAILCLPDNAAIVEMHGGVHFNTTPIHSSLELEMNSEEESSITKRLKNIYTALFELEKTFINYQEEGFMPPYPTLNVGIVKTQLDQILIQGVCRIPPMITPEIYEAWFEDLKIIGEQNGVTFKVTDSKRPFRTHRESDLIQTSLKILKDLNMNVQCGSQSSTNEASVLSRWGVESVSFGPGKREGNIHTPQEHVEINQLEKSVEFYRHCIERFCL
jgi:acetylornithine deacetylase/succinyl-diaminopimelate desuccinylase-like protein